MAALPEPAVSDDDIPQRVKDSSRRLSWIRSLLLRTRLDDDVCNRNYAGNGTHDDPYIIDYLHNDRQDAMNFSKGRKWAIAVLQSLSTFAVTFASSVYVSGIEGVVQRFEVSKEVATLGLSLFVFGFALGPLIWAPLSEVYGRKSIYVISYTAYTAFSVAAACSPNITALLVLRFFASACGSSSMTNTGGFIVDMFSKAERGVATGLFITAPFLGPALGPIAGGFLGETQGWRWILGLVAILGGVIWIATTLATRETYAPFILRCRAKALSRMTGSVYVSRLDAGQPSKTLSQELLVSLTRPWMLLFREPIVLLASLYVSIIYGTLYMFFAGFPTVFQVTRGWSQGTAGLPFVGVAIGVCFATVAAGVDNKRYVRLCAAADAEGRAVEPEARLGTAMVGSIVLPIGLFLFAWTTYPSVHWILPIIGAMFFSFGLVMVFISLVSYLVDSYVVYAASVMAANSLLRSLFGTAFPLFTTQMYENLGNQWASSIPAFLVLGCVPVPFLFHKYGPQIRSKCKYASEAAKVLEVMRRRHVVVGGDPNGLEKEAE
ncbi:MFS general substrate transporter [Lophium mytilinum]|uniref:MFS general substrate transporter n=1 Tax=Lophium mytilinum TaxID=390894 RepID=A0A6A6QH23_9PEZI|nr:MFS general substrate transporter [Lophium mytilinum]